MSFCVQEGARIRNLFALHYAPNVTDEVLFLLSLSLPSLSLSISISHTHVYQTGERGANGVNARNQEGWLG